MQTVQVSIRQGAGNYWNGTSFGSATEVWNAATGTTTWNYGFTAGSFPANGSYTVRVRATDVAGNIETPFSATFTYDTVAPALPTGLASSPVGPANDNNPEITGTAEAGSTVRVYPDGGLHRRRLGDRDCSRLRLARSDGRGHRRHLHDLQGDGDGRGRQRQRLLDRVCHLRRGLDRARTAERARLEPGLACERQQPGDHRQLRRRARRSGSIPTAACTGGASATGTAAAFASPGLTVPVSDDTSTTFKATATDAAGNVSGLLELLGYVCGGLDRAGAAERSRLEPGLACERQQPGDLGLRRGGLHGSVYTTVGCTGGAAATGTAAAFASPGLTVAVAGDSSTTFKATATDAAGNVSGCSSSSVTYVEDSTAPGLPSVARLDSGLPGERQQPRDLGHRRGGLDGSRLHDERLLRRRRGDRHRSCLRRARA